MKDSCSSSRPLALSCCEVLDQRPSFRRICQQSSCLAVAQLKKLGQGSEEWLPTRLEMLNANTVYDRRHLLPHPMLEA